MKITKPWCASLGFVVTLAAAVLAQTSENNSQRLTPEQAVSLRQLSDLRWSPGGARLALTVQEPPKGTGRLRHIWVYNPGAQAPSQFTNSSKSESQPRWSPDGRQLAFLSDREEFQQIYLMPVDGGEARRLTEGKRSIELFEWSPDGKQIAFLAPQAKTEDEEKKEKDKDDARVADRDDKRTHLWLIDVASGKTREVAGAPWHFRQAEWAPSGDRLFVTATDRRESDQETSRIFSVGVADGKMKEISAPKGAFAGLRVSPDGKQIAYAGCRVDGPAPHDLYVQSVEGGTPRNLTAEGLDRPVEGFVWLGDGKLLTLVADGFRHKFYTVDTNGHAELLAVPEMAVAGFDALDTGKLAFVGENTAKPQELWVKDAQAEPKRVSSLNAAFVQGALSQPEFVRYKSFDGLEIEGALLKPLTYDGKVKLPTVLVIHGGPTGNFTDSFESWGQLLAAAGYAVFYPNLRGSTGYGYQFMVLNRGDWGGGDFKDVMAAVDYLIARGIADPQRLGIAGWSYGGYMSEWAITQSQRFKAAVSGAGMADLAAEYGTEEHPSYDEWFYGLPYEKPDGFIRSSPITHIRKARTPTLILQGEADTIDPLGQSQQLYRALKRYGVPSDFVVYPREGHGLREEKHVVDRLRRIVAWFDKYLQ
jgi:dipeptidyl aminopeptidase/acylaminoacyl peptidase